MLREFQSSYAICHQVVASFGVCGETVQYGHDRATTHGFRAVASTILNETNLFNRDWIERQLSHVERTKYDAPTTLRSACLGWLTHILAQDLSLSRRDPETGLLSRFCEVEQGLDKRLNDGRVDARGRLWIGTRDNELHRPNDSLYCVDGNGAVTRMFGDVIVTNGIAFSPDNRLRRDPAPILRCQAARWRRRCDIWSLRAGRHRSCPILRRFLRDGGRIYRPFHSECLLSLCSPERSGLLALIAF